MNLMAKDEAAISPLRRYKTTFLSRPFDNVCPRGRV